MTVGARHAVPLLLFVPLLSGCATLGPLVDRAVTSENIAREAGFEKEIVPTQDFHLTSYHKIARPGEPIHFYIEGDGLAWLSRTDLSMDPTPGNPVALKLAAEDHSSNIVYLARPCQHSSLMTDDLCKNPAYWSTRRFSEEVIAAENEAVDYFVKKSGAREITLSGYSGGGAVAVLVAARQSDVSFITTYAGNLDTDAFVRHHKVSPLTGSLNPRDFVDRVSHIPQKHYVGSKDKVIPRSIAESFGVGEIIEVAGATHENGWHLLSDRDSPGTVPLDKY